MPLELLNWATVSYAQMMTIVVAGWGDVVSSTIFPTFKGSNESSTALSLKAHLAKWVRSIVPDAVLQFEYSPLDDEEADDPTEAPCFPSGRRIDLHVEGVGDFEVESMAGSGPMELFYYRKVLSRPRTGEPFWLVVPNTAILWAGPYLSDLAHYLNVKNGQLVVPATEGTFLSICGMRLDRPTIESLPADDAPDPEGLDAAISERPIRLQDVAGYEDVRKQIGELIIWPEKHRQILSAASRSSGVLFFGPPGCGKSRWARAIARELEHEVRLLAPSDLRGLYVGWGQIMIREQFDWLAENDKRMLIIDELDAVARSRHEAQMHSDEKACVNELLVQMDRVLLLNRLLVATTNFVASMDDAVLRSGRFGRFIPVAPPDLDECIEILTYYLQRLTVPRDPQAKLRFRIPDRQNLRPIIAPLHSQNVHSGNLFCRADLEDAVNRAYLQSARTASPDGGWGQQTEVVEVQLTEDELTRSLDEAPRSVSAEALDQFLNDVKRFCSRQTMESLSRRLRPTHET
jgi:hypothetical protein